MGRKDVRRTELRLPIETHSKFVEKCGAAGVDLNAAIVAFCEGIVSGEMVLASPTAVKVLLSTSAGQQLGVNEYPPNNRSKREALRRIGKRNGEERNHPG